MTGRPAVLQTAALFGIFVASLVIGPSAEAMTTYRWKKRPLVVFAPDAASPALARQRATIAASRAGMAEREMVVVSIVADRVSSELGGGPRSSAAALRARFGVPRGAFRAILAGKDGGAKITSGQPITASTLFRTIDAMPMRRQEMRR